MAQATGTTAGRRRRGVFMPIPGRRCVLVALSVATVCGCHWCWGRSRPRTRSSGTWEVEPGPDERPPGCRSRLRRHGPRCTVNITHDRIELTVTSPNPGERRPPPGWCSAGWAVWSHRNAAPTQMLIRSANYLADWRVTYLSNGVQFLTMQNPEPGWPVRCSRRSLGSRPAIEGVLVFDRSERCQRTSERACRIWRRNSCCWQSARIILPTRNRASDDRTPDSCL